MWLNKGWVDGAKEVVESGVSHGEDELSGGEEYEFENALSSTTILFSN